MKTNKLTGKVLFGNILKPKSYSSSESKFVDDPRGVYQLTIVVDENHSDYLTFKDAVAEKRKEIEASPKYKKLVSDGVDVKFSIKDKSHTDKDGNVINGKRQVSLKRNAVNRDDKKAKIDIFNRFNEEYTPENDISFGADIQVAFTIGDSYIPKDNIWYLTLYILAVMIEKEASSSYGFTVHSPEMSVEDVAQHFDGEVVDDQEQELPF